MIFSNSDIGASRLQWAEFFAGGGMARAGLGLNWQCVFANDNDQHKINSYRENWSSDHLLHSDIGDISPTLIPNQLALAWASSPCQNFSSAGLGDGLLGSNSSAFVKWWELIEKKVLIGSAPNIIVLENVVGLLKSRNGLDFAFISECFVRCGYSFGVVLIDAIHFLPQSRPRVFIIAIRSLKGVPFDLYSQVPSLPWHPPHLVRAVESLPPALRAKHIWWVLPKNLVRKSQLTDIIDNDSSNVIWHSEQETSKLINSMTNYTLEKVSAAKRSGKLLVGTLFRRMRTVDGIATSRAEVRFDGIAGCLRASDGGSSRQMLVFVEGQKLQTRHMTSRESARLMGLPDSYTLPVFKTHAAKLVGDGVAVPVVRFLSDNLLLPLAQASISTADFRSGESGNRCLLTPPIIERAYRT